MKDEKILVNKCIEYINQKLDNILEIRLVSRLLIKNLVFYVKTDCSEVAVKFYVKDKESNFETEVFMYRFLEENKVLNIPKIIQIDRTFSLGNIVVMEWVSGQSLKQIIKREDFLQIKTYIELMLSDLSKMWLQNIENICTHIKKEVLGIDYRLKTKQEVILATLKQLKPCIDFVEIFRLYNILKEEIQEENFLINYDLSAHEFIIKNGVGYFIDFERFRIGDPNNDLARMFQSCTNCIFQNKELYLKIFEVFKNNRFFKLNNFCYYLIEKLLCSIYVAPNEIDLQQIKFYIDFVKTLLNNKNTLCYTNNDI